MFGRRAQPKNEEMASKFNIIAHRGHRSVAPENTLAAFQAALSEGYPHFELDAQLTSDGCCIVIHDDDLDRTTDGSGRVNEVQSYSSGLTCTCSHSRDRTGPQAFAMSCEMECTVYNRSVREALFGNTDVPRDVPLWIPCPL